MFLKMIGAAIIAIICILAQNIVICHGEGKFAMTNECVC